MSIEKMLSKVPAEPLKRVASIHDISGFGKCSTTVALPILSAAGLEVCVIPTAILSTHTSVFSDYTFRDLTEDLPAYMAHWKKLKLEFAAIYSGYLGSSKQVDMVKDFINSFRKDKTVVLIDPVLGDGGQLYDAFDEVMVNKMRKLCSLATVLVPNITEGCLLTQQEYCEGPYSKDFIENILYKLKEIGSKQVVLTGVYLNNNEIGAACVGDDDGSIAYYMQPKIEGTYTGTGDIFASFCLSGLLNNLSLENSAKLAVELTNICILRSKRRGTQEHHGVDFEGVLPLLIKRLNLFWED